MYYGCLTRSNRARWLATGILLFVSLALAVVYALEAHTCQDCDNTRQSMPKCKHITERMDPDGMIDVKECRQVLLVVSFAGFVVCAVTALIPCCAMTCCVEPPEFYTMEEQDDGMGCKELPKSAMAPSFAHTKTLSAQPHRAPPCSTTRGAHSLLNLDVNSREVKSDVSSSSSSIRGPVAAAAAIAAARGVRYGVSGDNKDRTGAEPQPPHSYGTVVSAGSRGSLIVDSSVDSGARPLLPEGFRRSSLTADSYSTTPSVAETSTEPTPRVDVPVILDVGPIAATPADVEASVNGDQGGNTIVACSARTFESPQNLEELSTMLTSIASPTHSHNRASAAHAACAGHAAYEIIDSEGPQSGNDSSTLLPPAAVFMHEALGSRYHSCNMHGVQNSPQGEIHAAEYVQNTQTHTGSMEYASQPMTLSPEQFILDSPPESTQQSSLPPQAPQPAQGPLTPTPAAPEFQSNTRSGDRGATVVSTHAAHTQGTTRNDAREVLYGYPGIVPRSLSKVHSSSANSVGSGRSVAAPVPSGALRTSDSEAQTESSISSASISYWATHAGLQRTSQHSTQHGTNSQQPPQRDHQGPPTQPPPTEAANSNTGHQAPSGMHYSMTRAPHSTGSIQTHVETLSASISISSSSTKGPNSCASSAPNTNTNSQPYLPLTPLPDSQPSENTKHSLMPLMHMNAVQLPRSSSARDLREAIDARMHSMHATQQNTNTWISNSMYLQTQAPGSGGLQACSKATSWYHPSGRKQQPSSAMHASRAPSFSMDSKQQAAQDQAMAAYSHSPSDTEHCAVVNQPPKATLATVGPQSVHTQGSGSSVPALALPPGMEVASEAANLSDRSLLKAAQHLRPRRSPQYPPGHPINALGALPSIMEPSEKGSSQSNVHGVGPSGPWSVSNTAIPSPSARRPSHKDSGQGAEVSAAWARVAGGSSTLNAWYQQDRLPRSADDTGLSSPRLYLNSKLDAKWVAFARQEVAELRLPTLQPKATFLL